MAGWEWGTWPQVNGAVVGPVRWKGECLLLREDLPEVMVGLRNCRKVNVCGMRTGTLWHAQWDGKPFGGPRASRITSTTARGNDLTARGCQIVIK